MQSIVYRVSAYSFCCFSPQSLEKYVQNLKYSLWMQWHECHMDNNSDSSHHNSRGNHSSDEFWRITRSPILAKLSTQWLKVDLHHKSTACWSIQISKWWTHVRIFFICTSWKNKKSTVKALVSKAKTKSQNKENIHINYTTIVKIKLGVGA